MHGNVSVRAGTYLLTNAIALTASDSGCVWSNYPGESVSIIGGSKITNWSAYSGSIYVTDVSTQGITKRFTQLIQGSARQTLARYPNYVGTGTNSYNLAASSGSGTQFGYNASDLPRAYNTNELQVFTFGGLWNCGFSAVVSTNAGTMVLATSVGATIQAANRWFLQNSLNELDAPGEWYLDITNKFLFFWPSNSISSDAIYAPVATNLFTVGAGASNVTIRGFTMQCCEGAAVVLNNTTNCLVAGNILQNSGNFAHSGIELLGGSGNGAVGNDIGFAGKWGVQITGGVAATLTDGNNYADNNYIHDVGVADKFLGAGVLLYNTSSGSAYVCGDRISRNVFINCPRHAVFFEGPRHQIVSNYVYNVMLETDDGGAFYGGGPDWMTSWGTVISHNYIERSMSYGFLTGLGYIVPSLGEGIYLDWKMNGVSVFNNIIARCRGIGIYVNGGVENHITNNILYLNQSDIQPVASRFGSFTLEGFLVNGTGYGDSGEWGTWYSTFQTAWSSATNSNASWLNYPGFSVSPSAINTAGGFTEFTNVFCRNVIVNTNAPYLTMGIHVYNPNTANDIIQSNAIYTTSPSGSYFAFGTNGGAATFAQWQSMWSDTSSITNDPIVNPATWLLDASSPAVTVLGFQQIHTNAIGCYADSMRATWPLGSYTSGSTPRNTWFVATNGNDSAAGTSGAPWLTLDHAITTVADGDTIKMISGNYDWQHNLDSAVPNITITTNGGPVRLSGAGLCVSHTNWVLSGLTFTNTTFAHHINACVAVNTNAHELQIINCTLTPNVSNIFPIYFLDLPNSPTPQHQTPDRTAGNCIISNNLIANVAAAHYMRIQGSNNLVVANALRDGITVDLFVIHGCSNVVRGNYCTNFVQVSGLGIHPDILQTWGWQAGDPTSPFIDSYGNIVEGNQFWNFDGALSQLTCDYDTTNSTGWPTMGGWIVRNNLYFKCGPIGGGSRSTLDIPNCKFINNTYILCGNDVDDSAGLIGVNCTTNTLGSATNTWILNNAFVGCGKANGDGAAYSAEGTMPSAQWNLHTNYNFVCTSNFGTVLGIAEMNGINGGDPKFADWPNRSFASSFRPLSGSPLIDSGTNVAAWVQNDYDGMSRSMGATNDIGFLEFDPSLQVHCTFGENVVSSNALPDSTGYGHTGINWNATNWITTTAGPSDNAGQWTVVGVMTNDPGQTYNLSQYAGITNLSGIQFLTNGTIAVWVQWATNGERWDTILDCGYSLAYSWDPTVSTNSWAMHYGSPDLSDSPTGPVFKKYGSSLNDTNGVLMRWTQPRDGSTWWHIAVSWNASSNLVWGYQNGVCIATNSFLNTPYLRISGSPRLTTPIPWLSVGAMEHDGTPQWGDDKYPNSGFFKGKMDDLRIYNRSLSAGEVAAIASPQVVQFAGAAGGGSGGSGGGSSTNTVIQRIIGNPILK